MRSEDAVVICTRNRPTELARTLESVAVQSGAAHRLVIVVDGSDRDDAERTAEVVQNWRDKELPFRYHRYSGSPAGTRQRNGGVDLLPESVSVVHFIDDDMTLRAGYFDALRGALNQHPQLLGVGGVITESDGPFPRPPVSWGHRLFLLRTDQPSCVLPSGQTTPAWPLPGRTIQPAEWLATGASSYRTRVFSKHHFDPAAEGPSPRFEDLDFSFRVAQEGPLAVVPDARCVHRGSARNPRGVPATAQERIARRYWFIEKNLDRPLNRLAFWWSIVGQLIAVLVSSDPNSSAALRGLLRGIRTVLTRDHPLLRP
jgi:GT2 family glycosyltransferase